MPLAVLRPDYIPPDSLAAWEKRHIDPILDQYTYIAILDKDVTAPPEFFEIWRKCNGPDIITFEVRPSSLVFRLWEDLTFWVRLGPRNRGCAVMYSTDFLKSLGGWPLVTTPDTWLERHSRFTVHLPLVVIHNQSFNLSHSVHGQIRDGKSRAELRYSFVRTILHSIVRVRPLVLVSYLWERLR